MQELWARLEAWVRTNTGKSLRLRPGLDEAAIQAAEQQLGLQFPADYRASLLAHDGQDVGEEPFEWLPGCSPLKPLSAVIERWTEEQELAAEFPDPENQTEGPLHTVLWHPKRIPIAGSPWWDGDNTYVDLHPSPTGTVGQITTFVTECDLECLGSSLRSALERYLAALESGDWVYSKAKDRVAPKDEPPDEYPNESARFAQYLRGEPMD
jgi:cell wall assembly regulator SMI1